MSVLVRLRHSPGGEVDALANGKYIADLWRYLLQAGNWAQFPIFLIFNRVRRELQCKRKSRSTGVPCSTQNETVVKIKITCFPHSQPAPPQLKRSGGTKATRRFRANLFCNASVNSKKAFDCSYYMENIVVQTLCRLRTRISQHTGAVKQQQKEQRPSQESFFWYFSE